MSDNYRQGLKALNEGKVNLATQLFKESTNPAADEQLAQLAARKQRQKISACLITKNNQKTLADCLASLYPYNFEIVIADTGSTDGTLALARQFTDKVYHFDWVDDFAAARNFAASKASHDYIITLDSDERLVGSDKKELEKFFASQDTSKTVGLYRVVSSLSKGKQQNQIVNDVIRVYDRRYCQYYYKIHEQVGLIRDRSASPYAYVLNVRALHDGYQDEKTLKQKSRRNVKLLLAQLEEDSNQAYFIYQLAKSYYILGNNQQAFEFFAKFFALKPNSQKQWVRDAIDAYIKLCVKAKQYQKALDCIATYYDQLQGYFDILCLFATVYLIADEEQKAIDCFKQALKLNSPQAGEFGWSKEAAYQNLARIYERQGKWALAKKCLEHVKNSKLKLDPNLSLLVLADEETDQLEACLKSLAVMQANYVIIVRGKNKKTIELARQYSEAVHHFSGSQAQLGAYLLTKLQTNYGLIVYANEKLLGADPEAIKQLTAKKAAIVGRIRVKLPLKDDELGYQIHEPRLLVKSYAKFNGPLLTGIVSKKPKQLLNQVELPLILAKNVSYEAYAQSELAKQQALRASLDKQANPTLSWELATSYYYLQNYSEACQAYLEFLSGPLDLGKEETLSAVTNLIAALIEVKDYQRALEVVLTFNPYYDGLSDFQFAAGLAYMNGGRFDQAQVAFTQARQLANSDSLGINGYLSYYQQGVIYEVLGQKQEAIGAYRLAGDYQPALSGLERLLGEK